MDFRKITVQAIDVIREVAGFIKASTEVENRVFETKGLNSFVTKIDLAAEKKLVHGLSAIDPKAGFITEEAENRAGNSSNTWVIDPLDGTTNFIHGIPVCSISVAYMQDGQPVIGIVHDIFHDECFFAWKNGGAFVNNKPIHVTETGTFSDALMATGFPYYDFGRKKMYLELLGYFMENTRGIRRLGSAAIDLAYVACGRFDIFYETTLNIWDVAAGVILVQEAGGVVSDFKGGDDYLTGGEIIASGKPLMQHMLDLTSKYYQ
jgi:myo-inositol-1(or 4)-monophosphatase